LIYELGEDDRVKQISVVLYIEGAEMPDHSSGTLQVFTQRRKVSKGAPWRLPLRLCVKLS
jgi:hypothetical protein